MILIKKEKEIEIMREGGKRLKLVLVKVLENLKPQVTTGQLDKIAEREILRLGGKPSFKMVPGYSWSTCITINDEVVHGIPGKKQVKEGDIVGVDVGIYYQGFHTDMAYTVLVEGTKGKRGDDQKRKFLEVGKRALTNAIMMIKSGNHVGDISLAAHKVIEKGGYFPVQSLTGHGVGRNLHEDPRIPCFFPSGKSIKDTPILKKGMVLAIEIIYNQGSPGVVLTTDGWIIKTEDGKISGLFENTVAVLDNSFILLTQ